MTTLTYTTLASLVAGSPEKIADVVDCLQKIQAVINGNVDDATNLTSPNNAVWRPVLGEHAVARDLTTGLFHFGQSAIATGSGVGAGGITALWVPPSAGDVAVAGKTTRLRLRIPWAVNATNAGINVTWGLYPISSLAGGVGVITPTLGTVIAGSTANAPTLTAGTAGVATGASFDLSAVTGSATGAYCIGVTGSGAMAANSMIPCELILEMRHT